MKTIKQIIYLSFIAFTLHYIWENAQAPLFKGWTSFSQHFSICFLGTVGDIVITLSVYLIISLLKNDFYWIIALNKKDLAMLATVGFFIAVGIEWRALLFGRWAYNDTMPIVPYFKVGLAPIIQMTLLLPFSMYIVKKLMIRHEN